MYQNQIDIATKNDVRQRFKIASINNLLYCFNKFINYEVCEKITSEFKDKLSDDQLNKIIKVINEYSKGLDLLDDYDHQCVPIIMGKKDDRIFLEKLKFYYYCCIYFFK